MNLFIHPMFWGPGLVGIVAAIIFGLIVRRKSVSRSALISGAVSFFSGLLICFYMFGHTLVNIVNAVTNKTGEHGDQPFTYNFRFYSLILIGVMFFTLGAKCLRAARAISRGDADAWRRTVKISALLIVLTVPLIPFQPAGAFFAIYASLNLIGLVASRRHMNSETHLEDLNNKIREAVEPGSIQPVLDRPQAA